MKKGNRLIGKVGQLILVFVIALLMLQNFTMVNLIQGTGRVINYAGIVRGATQRMIKLEITGHPEDEMILYLDEIINDLQYGGGKYNLDKLKDSTFQKQLEMLTLKWGLLKKTITEYRSDNSIEDKLIADSEEYFQSADEIVDVAENYSEGRMAELRIFEYILFAGVVLLVLLSFKQMYNEIRLTQRNRELSAFAYLDKLTGIPSRRSCEERIWFPADLEASPHCVAMFDLNNLKTVNDELGHHTGDKLIKAFADILIKFNSDKVFVGRFGGDEFLMIVRDYEEMMVKRLVREIDDHVEDFNSRNQRFKISYACGYQYGGDNIQKMLEQADEKMYINKRLMKEELEKQKEAQAKQKEAQAKQKEAQTKQKEAQEKQKEA
jgi:diguanylate cyclase (GGDEF)-like protein